MHLHYLDSEPILFVCHESNGLAGAEAVRLEQIADEAFIDSPVGWGNRTVVDGAFAAAGLQRTVHTETTDFVLGQALVRERLGVMCVPASAVSTDPQLVALAVEPALIWTARLGYSASRPLSAAAAALVGELVGELEPRGSAR